MHTSFSLCGKSSIREMIDRAAFVGLDGICITDHNTMEASARIREGRQHNGLVVIIGMEYTAISGDFLIFGPFNDIPAGMSAEELLHFVNEAEGAAVAAHPCRKERLIDETVFESGLCGITEVENGRNSSEENRAAAELLSRYSLKGVAGSDAHSTEELGAAVTLFDGTVESVDDLINALNSGSYRFACRWDKIIP